ncbi:hypothetical protein [Nonomuraea sp. SYSU D8015]|uniref:hypothetical protein n=1 Tax=Nonomuraea sp. SYSU D8015 TaxID=2593644 RepID=UPI0016601DBD|nr:hypothetical protein [Nonomuraea sp. SYSU D8015]
MTADRLFTPHPEDDAQAMLAMRTDLARIATALELLAKTPAAIQHLAGHVSAAGQALQNGLEDLGAEVHNLTATVNQGVEFADSTAAAVGSVAETVHELTDTVDRLAEPRPRWWQWRRRRTIRKASPSGPVPHMAMSTPDESTAEVYEFRVDLRRQSDIGEQTVDKALASGRFTAEYEAAYGIALKMLPGLCTQAGVAVDPNQVYGRIFRSDREGRFWHVNSVFLPGVTVLDAPPGGF